MNTKHTLGTSLFALGAMVLLGGCTASSDAIKQGKASLELKPTKRIALIAPTVTETDGMVKVSGRVQRIGMASMPIRGHVHVDLLDAEGTVLQSGRDDWSPAIPAHRPGRSLPNSASYAVTFPTTLPSNGTVRVTVGTDSHEE